MNGIIEAEGPSINICVMNLNGLIRKNSRQRVDFVLDGDVQIICPTKDGERWKARVKYKSEDIKCKLVIPKIEYSYILTEAESLIECEKKHKEERIYTSRQYKGVTMFDSQVIVPRGKDRRKYMYCIYSYPAE